MLRSTRTRPQCLLQVASPADNQQLHMSAFSPTKITCTSMLLWLQMVEKELGKVDESSAETLIDCVNKLQKLKSVKGSSLGDTRSTQWAA